MAIEDVFYVGNGYRLPILIEDTAGTDADPASLAVTVLSPANVELSYVYGVDSEVVRDSTGNYHMDILLEVEGLYRWRTEAENPFLAREGKVLAITDFN